MVPSGNREGRCRGNDNADQASTHPTRCALRAATRARDAAQLRAEGRSFEEIAQQLGYQNRSGAYKAVARACAQSSRIGTETDRGIGLYRLEEIQVAVSDRCDLAYEHAVTGGDYRPFIASLQVLRQITKVKAHLTADFTQPVVHQHLRRDGLPEAADEVLDAANRWTEYLAERHDGYGFEESPSATSCRVPPPPAGGSPATSPPG